MAITRIGHLAMIVRDMEKATAFYEGILGFRQAFEMIDDKGKPWIRYFTVTNGQFLELFYPNDAMQPEAGRRIGYSHICFEVDDIKSTADAIVANGGALDQQISKGRSGNLQCWVKDPDGNRIELMQILPDSLQAKSSK